MEQQRLIFKRLRLTKEKWAWLWAEMVKLGAVTMNDDAKTPDKLWEALSLPDALHFDVQTAAGASVGLASLMAITEWSAVCHCTFFDRRLRGRERAIHDVLRVMMRQLGLQVIHAYLPVTQRASVAWCQRVGFTLDGVIRRSLRRGGVLVDNAVLSLTRERAEAEWSDGTNGRQPTEANVDASVESRGEVGAGHSDALRPRLAAAGADRLRGLPSGWGPRTPLSGDAY